MARSWQIPRRSMLRGAGLSLGLPLLECMLPDRRQAQGAVTAKPKRLVFFVFPQGTPERYNGRPGCLYGSGGNLGTPTELIKPLDRLGLLGDIMLVNGLHNKIAVFDHYGQVESLLTQVEVKNADGSNATADISVDQVAANAQKAFTPRLPSLFLGTSTHLYPYNGNYLAWKNATTPLEKILEPREAFDRILGQAAGANPHALEYRNLVLDRAKGDADRLKARLGRGDRDKLDQYLAGIGDLESRINASAKASAAQCAQGTRPPAYGDLPTHIDQMLGLIKLAFQCDQTRVVVFMLQDTQTSTSYPWLGDPIGKWMYHSQIVHHAVSDEMGSATVTDEAELVRRMDAYVKVSAWHIEQFGKLAKMLKDTTELDGGSLLDNTLMVCTSEMGYGDGHFADNLPVILAGGRSMGVKAGRQLDVGYHPIANLWVSMLQAIGLETTKLGISDGSIPLG